MTASTLRIRPPAVPATLLDRPRVSNRILCVPPAELMVITAPVGYGATTAVAQAVRVSGDRVYWVSLDAAITDAQCRELLYAAVGSSPQRGIDGVLDALEISSAAWLIVDGVAASAHPGFTRDLLRLAEHLPSHLRMVVTSHEWFGPAPRAIRLTAEDLAFIGDESFELLARLRPDLEIDAADEVATLCQGWASALAAVCASRGAGDWLRGAGAVSLFSHWFAGLPAEQRDFLCQTRVLREMCAASAGAVTGLSTSAEMMLALDASNAYLSEVEAPVADTGRWWRRHTLLSAYLDQACSGDDMAEHSRAADWYLNTSDVDSVIHHLLAGGRLEEAAAYLSDHESMLLSAGGNADKVLTWYDKMGQLDDHFMQLLRRGWGQALSGDLPAADATVNRLNQELVEHRQDRRGVRPAGADGDDPLQPGTTRSGLVAQAALLKSYLACCHADPATVVAGARRMAIEPPEHLNSDSVQLAPILVARGLVWSGQPEAAGRVLETAMNKPLPNDVMRETHLGITLALADVTNGYVRRAKTRIDATHRWMQRMGLAHDTRNFGPSLAVSAQVALELGELDSALIVAQQALEDAQRSGVMAEIVWSHLVIAQCDLMGGDYGAAMRALGEGRALATRDVPDSSMVVVVDQLRAAVHMAAGDMVRAVRIIRSLPPSDTRSVLWARAGVSRQPAVARRTLESIQSCSPRIEAQRHELLAAVHARVSRRMAQGHLRKAAAIAHKHGLGQLLNQADSGLLTLAESSALEYQDDNLLWLLKIKSAPRLQAAVTGAETPLSRGELQLLSVLPSRSKNAEIAESMGVSINTVKTRLRRLYAKLGANNRDEAIDVARQRGLLQ